MRLLYKLFAREQATATLLMAAAMIVLAGFAALVIDAGLVYLNQGKMMNALDSAVLAGAQELPDNPDNAVLVARNYAALNGMPSEQTDFQVDAENRSISGSGQKQVNTIFARALGFNNTQIQAQSKARIVATSAATGVVPFGVMEGDYSFGEQVILKEGGGDGEEGWYNALRLGGQGAFVYLQNIEFGYSGEIRVGDIINIEPGNMSGPTESGIEYRISQCHHVPRCTAEHFVEGCPRILVVPMIRIEDMNEAGHTFTVKVVGFGAFLVDDYIGSGTENEVVGSFIRYVIPAAAVQTADDFGLYSAQLCE